jgi:hypothetical protein
MLTWYAKRELVVTWNTGRQGDAGADGVVGGKIAVK